jgi:signal transduction histidine kinase/CheY-like chemotaxis protein
VDVFGYTREDIPDVDTWWERAYPDAAYRAELHAVWQQVREVVAPGKSPIPPMEVRFARKDGELRTVLISGVFIRDYRLMTLDDITERKSLEAALQSDKFKAENASRSKSRFLAAASHDLRQPAHALGMFVARMAELPNDPQARHLVTCMEASVRAMQDMLDGFFDISRLDDESTPLNLVAFPMAGVFEQLQGSFARAAEEKGLRLRFRPTDVWVRTEPGLLQRILLNLVSNALRYTQHGSVLVACRPTRDGTHVRVEVWDSGIGMAAQHHEEIYTEFFQIGNPERDRAKGLGVGLSIVDRACRQLHHPLAMRSVLGQGSRFSLRVPLANDHAQDRPKLAAVAPTWLTLKGLHILFIEDDVLGREGLASLLSSWGCQVTVAAGARMACHLYQTNPCVNLIISDFRLGGDTNGIEAIQMLRALAGKPIAACLVTGDTDASVKNQAQEAGLFFLQKPVRPAKLRSLLRHMLQTGTPEAVSTPA